MVSWASGRLLNVLADDAIVWQLGSVFDSLNIAVAVTLGAVLFPFERLRGKSIVAALAVVTWLEVLYLLLHYSVGLNAYNTWLLGQLVAFVSVTAFYWFRPYYSPSDPLDDQHLFLLSRKPHTAQGFFLSMLGFFGAYGGFALYARGLIYSYRNGILRAVPYSPSVSDTYHIRRGGLITSSEQAELSALIGARWSVRENCLGLRKLWGFNNGMDKGIWQHAGVGNSRGARWRLSRS